jgi:hypothetical protein
MVVVVVVVVVVRFVSQSFQNSSEVAAGWTTEESEFDSRDLDSLVRNEHRVGERVNETRS